MSTSNDAHLAALAAEGVLIADGWGAPNASSQATATRLQGNAMRVTTSVANGSVVLPSSLSNECPYLAWVINDSPNTILAYPFTGEKQNGGTNATLAIPSGQSGYFVRVPPAIGKGGGGGGTLDWRSAVVP